MKTWTIQMMLKKIPFARTTMVIRLKTSGNNFCVPDTYPITVAHSNKDGEKWIQRHLMNKENQIAVFFDSAQIHDTLNVPPDIPRDDEELLAIACSAGLLLCVRDSEEEWPMPAVTSVLSDSGRHMSALLPIVGDCAVIDEHFVHITDIRTHAFCIANERVERCAPGSVFAPFGKLVEAFLHKSLGNPHEANARVAKIHPRARAAVKIAAAVLAMYSKITRMADADRRSQHGRWSEPGFADLVDVITGMRPMADPASPKEAIPAEVDLMEEYRVSSSLSSGLVSYS